MRRRGYRGWRMSAITESMSTTTTGTLLTFLCILTFRDARDLFRLWNILYYCFFFMMARHVGSSVCYDFAKVVLLNCKYI